MSWLQVQMRLYSLHDRVRIAEHTRRSRTNLYMELPHRITVIHRIKRRNLYPPSSATSPNVHPHPLTINPHRRHLQQPRNLIHNTDATKPVLSLPQIQQWHDCRFFVLRWIPLQDLINKLLVLCIELERDAGVVLRRVAMLCGLCGLIGWKSFLVGGRKYAQRSSCRCGGWRWR